MRPSCLSFNPSTVNISAIFASLIHADKDINDTYPVERLEEAIKRRLLLDWQNGIAMNRRRVLSRLEQWGLKINRGNSENTLSVTSDKLTDKNGKPMRIRLKGGMFEKRFDGRQFRPVMKEEKHSKYDSNVNRNERKELNETLLATGIEIKEAYHQERYKSSA